MVLYSRFQKYFQSRNHPENTHFNKYGIDDFNLQQSMTSSSSNYLKRKLQGDQKQLSQMIFLWRTQKIKKLA